MSIREVAEGLLGQGSDESLMYSIDITNWGSDPPSISVKVYDENLMTDVTQTVMPTGSLSVADDIISLPLLKNLTIGASYRVEVLFTIGLNIWQCYFRVRCER
ncbi:hypothetical protein LCGC14_1491740 [marine sediment metagenome]|uniref:CARDB domain-containing protein n=1 Tax=marine sediment metagenome TaxID=412755 RepID=A0A0F9J797_9ZZZZ